MPIEKHVVVVDPPDGALASVMAELDELGFRVIWVPDFAAAIQFVRSHPKLSLVLASAAAVATGGEAFLIQMKELEPGVPIVWGVRSGGPVSNDNGPRPDRVLHEPFHVGNLTEVARRLLCEQFYPRSVVGALKVAAIEVLEPVGSFHVAGDPYLKANDTALSELSAVLTFSGEVAGHLIVGTDIERGRQLYHRVFPDHTRPTLDRVEDLVGELCNQILGRINAFFAQRSVRISQASPLFIRASGGVLRCRGQQPSLGFEVVDGDIRVSLEYYVNGIEYSALERRVPTDIVGLGEIRYL